MDKQTVGKSKKLLSPKAGALSVSPTNSPSTPTFLEGQDIVRKQSVLRYSPKT